jgi:hypothetical protein
MIKTVNKKHIIYIHLMSREDVIKDLLMLQDDDGDNVYRRHELEPCTNDELEIMHADYFVTNISSKVQIEGD